MDCIRTYEVNVNFQIMKACLNQMAPSDGLSLQNWSSNISRKKITWRSLSRKRLARSEGRSVNLFWFTRSSSNPIMLHIPCCKHLEMKLIKTTDKGPDHQLFEICVTEFMPFHVWENSPESHETDCRLELHFSVPVNSKKIKTFVRTKDNQPLKGCFESACTLARSRLFVNIKLCLRKGHHCTTSHFAYTIAINGNLSEQRLPEGEILFEVARIDSCTELKESRGT